MIHRHHIAIVDNVAANILAYPTCGRPLPIVTTDGVARCGDWLPRWLAERGMSGILQWTWLGRSDATLTACDWLVVVAVHPDSARTEALRWHGLARLTDMADGYQRLALEMIAANLAVPGVLGLYSAPNFWNQIRSWVSSNCFSTERCPSLDLRRIYKATPTRFVCSFSVRGHGAQVVYVKGDLSRSSNERDIVRLLQVIAPDIGPHMLAENAALGLQVLEEAGGALNRSTSREILEPVMRVFGKLQRHWTESDVHIPSVPPYTADDFSQLVTRLLLFQTDEVSYALHRTAMQTIGRMTDCGCPLSLVHIDPAMSNIRIGNRGVRFIDFENAIVAPALLGFEILLNRLEEANQPWPSDLSAHLRRVYEASWNGSLGALRCSVSDNALRGLARTVVAAVHWKTLCERVETGEWDGPLERVWSAAVRRLSTSLHPSVKTVSLN
jgi:hypothetical protein